MNILVINGPNLNLLGIREPEIYGTDTLEELMLWLENCPECINHNFKFYQSNHEGDIIDYIQDERQWAQGIIINPGAFTHYSYAIYDALKAINIQSIEVHLSDIFKTILKVVETEGIKDSGYRVTTNSGKDANQEVQHLHFHVIGGRKLGRND